MGTRKKKKSFSQPASNQIMGVLVYLSDIYVNLNITAPNEELGLFSNKNKEQIKWIDLKESK